MLDYDLLEIIHENEVEKVIAISKIAINQRMKRKANLESENVKCIIDSFLELLRIFNSNCSEEQQLVFTELLYMCILDKIWEVQYTRITVMHCNSVIIIKEKYV